MQIEYHGKKLEVVPLITEETIKKRILTLADEIHQEFSLDETLIVLIVLHGALIFAADLVRNFKMPTEIETIRIKSYEGMKSTQQVQLLTPMKESFQGKNILIVEDIVDTGRSIQFLLEEINKIKPKKVKVCTLLNKPDAHEVSVTVDYVGFEIGKNFVIGYGLDLDGKYRNLPYVGEVTV